MLNAFPKPSRNLERCFGWCHISIHISSGDLLGGRIIVFSEELKLCVGIKSHELIITGGEDVEVTARWRDDKVEMCVEADFIVIPSHFRLQAELFGHQTPCTSSPGTRFEVLSGDLFQPLVSLHRIYWIA